MKTISHQEFLSFIFSQPRERVIKMEECSVSNPYQCGCMMVHYARNQGLGGIIRAGWHEINSDFHLEENIKSYFPCEEKGFARFTYGEIQNYLIKKGEKNPLVAENA